MILYVGNIVSGHGKTATTIETLGALLKAEGYDIVLTSAKKNKLLRLLDMLFTVFKYRKKVSHVLIDTYSTSNFYYAYLVSKLCIWFKIKYIPILHGGNLEQRLKNSVSKSKTIFENAHANVSPSLFLKTTFEKYGYKNLIHIPNNIELSFYSFKKRTKLEPKLLWVRSFAEIYNPEMAIHVVKELQNKGINASLCMIGPEKDGSQAKTQTLAKQLSVNVDFPGKLTKRQWTGKAADYDIFINTTDFDNTPISILEAMALGIPVVSTNVGGLPFLIDHKKDGILVAKNDVSGMVNAIETLLQNDNLVTKLTLQAQQKVNSFDWKVVKEQWKTLLAN